MPPDRGPGVLTVSNEQLDADRLATTRSRRSTYLPQCLGQSAPRHRISASTRRIRPARLHQQRESGRSDPVSQVVRAPRPIRAIARYWLGCTGWRDDQRRGLAIARSDDPRTYAGAVMYVYGGAIPGGVLGPDDSAIREIEDALHGAEQFGDEFALTLARLGLGDALVHRPTEADAGTASWPRSAKQQCVTLPGRAPAPGSNTGLRTQENVGVGGQPDPIFTPARRHPKGNRGLRSDDIRESRKSVSESRVRTPLESLAAEPTVDPLGDCLPSRLKHHVVAHVGKDFCSCVVGARGGVEFPFGKDAVALADHRFWRRCRPVDANS